MKRGGLCLVALLSAQVLTGQQLDIGSRTVMPGAEPPRASAAPLLMHSLHGVMSPAPFLLVRGDNRRFGPYDYADGMRIGSATAGLVLRVVDAGKFHLENPRDNSLLGPFPYSNEAELTVGANLFRVLRLPSGIAGRWRIGGALPGASSTLAVARMGAATIRALRELRAQLQALEERVRYESADVLFEGLPVIRGPGGYRRDNIVTRSQRDRENARRSAEASAIQLLERFVRDRMPLELRIAADGAFASPALPPGNYLICGLARVRDATQPNPAPSRFAVWWTECTLEKHDLVTYMLDDDNAIDWNSIFRR